MFGRNSNSNSGGSTMSEQELDAHLAERLPQLAAEAKAARASGNKRVEEAASQTINIALGRLAQRKGWNGQ